MLRTIKDRLRSWRKPYSPSRIKSLDWFARWVSVIAITISFASIYFTHFFQTERLSVIVLNYPEIRIAEQGFGFRGTLQLGFFNFGNTPIIVTNVGMRIQQNPDTADYVNVSHCEERHAKDFDLKMVPFVAKPGEGIVKDLNVPIELEKVRFVGESINDISARVINSCLDVWFAVQERTWRETIYFGRWGVGPDSLPIPSGTSRIPHILINRTVPNFDWMYRGFP